MGEAARGAPPPAIPRRGCAPARPAARRPQEGRDGQIQRWSREWRWVERAVQWDAHLDAQGRAAAEEAVRSLNQKHAQLLKHAFTKIVAGFATLDPAKLSASETLRWMGTVNQLERQVAGQPILHEVQHVAAGAEPPAGRGPGSFEPSLEFMAEVLAIINLYEVSGPEPAPGPPPKSADE